MTPRPAPRLFSFRPASLALAVVLAGGFTSGLLFAPPARADVGIGISITVAPPPLPYYEQPIMPGPGYLWVPGYWAYDPAYGYYWVPGTWVLPPYVGALWTPGYWFWGDGFYRFYRFHRGYWGPRVGYYGGIDYGYGYGGRGYDGGYWRGRDFYYNRTVNNFGNVRVTNVYNRTVIENNGPRVSFNGGQGGVQMRPTPQQEAFARQQHTAPLAVQQQHESMARQNPGMRFSTNRGNPGTPAVSRPGGFERPTPSAPMNPGMARPPVMGPQRPAPEGPNRTYQHGPTPAFQPQHTSPVMAPAQRPMMPEQRPPMQAPMRPQEPPRMNAPEQRPPQQAPRMAPEQRPPQQAPRMAPEQRPPQNQGHPEPHPQGHPSGDHGGDHRDDHHGG